MTHPTWVEDLAGSADEGLLGAAEHGLRSAVLVPIRDGIVRIAVLELMSRASVAEDAQLGASLEAIALQLGHFAHLLRQSATPHWALGKL